MWKKIITIAVLIILLAVFAFLDGRVKEKNLSGNNNETEESATDNFTTPVAARHQYKDGQHIFVGDISLPNSCYSYNAEITDGESDKQKNIVVTYNETEETVNCSENPQAVTFKVTHEGPEDTEFKLFVNDEERRLNIFEIPSNVDIDQFEIFMKG